MSSLRCFVAGWSFTACSLAHAGSVEGLEEADRARLLAAYEAARHGVEPTPSGWTARNPGQRLHAEFDGRGSTVVPHARHWVWGLQLARWGRAGSTDAVDQPAAACSDGVRVEYAWTSELSEWWINGARGLEHGFTVLSAPPGAGELVLGLEVRGELQPEVAANGRDVRFLNAKGACELEYSGLLVLDAAGRALPARLQVGESELEIVVDDTGAAFPVTIDPIVQQAYLKASNTQAEDRFGAALTVSGNTVAIGAYAEDSAATGIGGNQADNTASLSGAVYVFVRNGSSWSQEAYIKPANTGAGDLFGWSVALSGDTLLVGARAEDGSSVGVNGNPFDDGTMGAGAAYVFVRSGTVWTQQAYLKASNPDVFDGFGHAVALDGNLAVVTAIFEDSASTGIGGDQANNSAVDSGAAYVFARSGTTWSQTAYVKPSNTGANDSFGVTASVHGDRIAIGSRYEASNATGVGGDQSNNLAPDSGAVYVFRRSGAVWSQEAYIKASNTDPDDEFGTAISLTSDRLAVGAWGEASSATGVNGNPLDDSAQNAGAVYVFLRTGTTWAQEAYLKASNTGANDSFGLAVALSGNTLFVGAVREDSQAAGINGDQNDNSASNAGAAYVFVRNGSAWVQDAYLKASNPGVDDRFGWSVAASADVFVVGTYEEDSNATGVNGNQADNSAADAGAVYVFDRGHAPVPFCFGDGLDGAVTTPCGALGSMGACANTGAPGNGCANSVNPLGARLSASGTPNPDTIVLSGTGMPATVACIYLQGSAVEDQPFGDGVRCAGGTLIRLQTKTNVGGASQFPAPGDPSVSTRGLVVPGSGATRYYQTYYRNSAAGFCPPQTFNVTNGVALSW